MVRMREKNENTKHKFKSKDAKTEFQIPLTSDILPTDAAQQ